MKTMRWIAPLLALALCACQASENAGNDDDEHLLSGHERQLQRARDVEDQVLEAAERQRRDIDEDS